MPTTAAVAQFTTLDLQTPDDYGVVLPAYYVFAGVSDNTPADNAVDNRVATLGRVLFHDRRLSTTDTVSCATCHAQDAGFSDPRRFSVGVTGQPFDAAHSMPIVNLRFGTSRAFWDGRAESLEAQAVQPLANPLEMGWSGPAGGLPALLTKMRTIPYYPDLFLWAFGTSDISEDRIQRALAQFQRAIVSFRSRWDDGVAQVFQTNQNNPFGVNLPNFTADENRGLQLFTRLPANGGAGCSQCHNMPAFTVGTTFNLGLDATQTRTFRAPSLKNVANTAPYMHDGRFATLEHVIEFYNSGVQAAAGLDIRLRLSGAPQRLNLTAADRAALVAFLRTLSDPSLATDRRFSSPFR